MAHHAAEDDVHEAPNAPRVTEHGGKERPHVTDPTQPARPEGDRTLDLIYSGGLRGQIERMPYLATVLRGQRAACENALVLDAGGWASGTVLADRFQGQPMIDVMNELGYHAAGIGEADLAFGLAVLLQRAEQAHFPLLSANLLASDGRRLPGIEPFALLDADGLRVGVIGLSPPGCERAGSVRVTPPEAALTEALFILRGGGVGLFVVLSQLGLERDRALARAVPGVHCILGDDEAATESERIGDTVIARCAREAAAVGMVRLTLAADRAEGLPQTIS